MAHYEASLGIDPPSLKKELYEEYYSSATDRQKNESVLNYITRFRTLLGKMKREKIEFNQSELSYSGRS